MISNCPCAQGRHDECNAPQTCPCQHKVNHPSVLQRASEAKNANTPTASTRVS